MLVSVIVPVYNSEKYIAEALDSILASDYADIEVICIDDGSSDSSLQILEEYAVRDNRVRVYSQKNAGACVARNYAISLAKGELILPVDSDNKITSTFISITGMIPPSPQASCWSVWKASAKPARSGITPAPTGQPPACRRRMPTPLPTA